MIKLTLPLYVIQERKTMKDITRYINLNNYRNRHHRVSNNIKIVYESIVKDQLRLLDIGELETPILLTYTLFVGDKRKKDTRNILTIVDKFFCDALVEAGCIPDDTYIESPNGDMLFGGYEKGEGRVEVCVYNQNSQEDMKAYVQTKIDLYIKQPDEEI